MESCLESHYHLPTKWRVQNTYSIYIYKISQIGIFTVRGQAERRYLRTTLFIFISRILRISLSAAIGAHHPPRIQSHIYIYIRICFGLPILLSTIGCGRWLRVLSRAPRMRTHILFTLRPVEEAPHSQDSHSYNNVGGVPPQAFIAYGAVKENQATERERGRDPKHTTHATHSV